MADISFPPSLLAFLAGPQEYETTDDHARDKGEIGPARVRARSPRDRDNWPARLAPLNLARCDELKEFYFSTTARGARKFNIPHIRPGAASIDVIEARMSKIRWRRLGAANGEEVWAATFDIMEV